MVAEGEDWAFLVEHGGASRDPSTSRAPLAKVAEGLSVQARAASMWSVGDLAHLSWFHLAVGAVTPDAPQGDVERMLLLAQDGFGGVSPVEYVRSGGDVSVILDRVWESNFL